MKKLINGLNGAFQVECPEVRDESLVTEINISGRLPFLALLPESLKDFKVTSNRPFAIQVPNFGAEIRFQKIVNKDQELWGPVIPSEDIRADLTYSIFNLRVISNNDDEFPLNKYITDEDGNVSPKLIAQFCVQFVKHFVVAYKEVTDFTKDWIPEINISSLSPWSDIKAINYKGDSLFSSKTYSSRGTGTMIGNVLPPDTLHNLQEACMGKYIGLTAKSMMQIANRNRFQGDYIAYCLFLHSAFEYWIFTEVRSALLNLGKSTDETEALLKPNGQKQFISREKALKLIFGDMNFKNSDEYKNYREEVIDKRDALIHAKPIEIKESDVEKMSNAYSAVCNLLSQQILDFYKTNGIVNPKAAFTFYNPESTPLNYK